MKNIIVVLFGILIFACSSDNENPTQVDEDPTQADEDPTQAETGIVYVHYDTNASGSINIFNLDNNEIGEIIFNLPSPFPYVTYVSFSKPQNMFYYQLYIDCGNGGGCSSTGYIHDINTHEVIYTFNLSGDIEDNYSTRVIRYFENELFVLNSYTEAYPVKTLYKIDLNTGENTLLRDFIAEGDVHVSLSVYLENVNSLAGYGPNSVYNITSLDTFEHTSFDTGLNIENLQLINGTTLVGVSDSNKLVKINPDNGEILEVILEDNIAEIISWSYSESSGRYYFIDLSYATGVRISLTKVYDPSNGEVTLLSDDNQIQRIFVNN